MPGPIAQPDIARLCQREASPLATAWQAAAAFAGELEAEGDLVSALLVSQDDGAELAPVAPVEANDLPALHDGLFEQLTRCNRHHAARSLAAAGIGLKVRATATAASPTENEPI